MSEVVTRRSFLGAAAGIPFAGLSAVLVPGCQQAPPAQESGAPASPQDTLPSNLHAALSVPRAGIGMPGPWPGVVASISSPDATRNRRPVPEVVKTMLDAGMGMLAATHDAREAWETLFTPQDRIGIKVNPVGPRLVQTTHEVVRAVIDALEEIGVPRAHIAIWDRLQPMLDDAGFTAENFPGIECIGFIRRDTAGGIETWYGDDMMDHSVYYEFPLEALHEADEVHNQINTGHRSYYTTLLTQRFDKVINMPVPKDNGASFTVCFKNLAYGALSNVRRGHEFGGRFMAEACAFPPIRDKVVLNVIDGLRACYMGGPSGVSAGVWPHNTLYFATDPVAADSVTRDMIVAKQDEAGLVLNGDQQRERALFDTWLPWAENLGLGVYRSRPLDLRSATLN